MKRYTCHRCNRELGGDRRGIASHNRMHDRDDDRMLARVIVVVRDSDGQMLASVSVAQLHQLNRVAGKQLAWGRRTRMVEVSL